MPFNSPYGFWDKRVPYQAVPTIQDDFHGVCQTCFFGIHPHGENENSDCKVLLTDHVRGILNGSQCGCRWREEGSEPRHSSCSEDRGKA